MKKTTKSLWLYAALLFIIAIALIITATLLQARVISPSDGEIEVLGTFTRDIKQNVTTLTDENIRLSGEVSSLAAENASLKAALEETKALYEKELDNKETFNKLYKAYKNDDYKSIGTLLKEISEEESNKYINGLYGLAEEAYNEYNY